MSDEFAPPPHIQGLSIAVAIATAGRPKMLNRTVEYLGRQERRPDAVLVTPAKPADADPESLERAWPGIGIVSGPSGLSRQRNALLDAGRLYDLVVFFDDDFLPHRSFLAETERLFLSRPDVVVATGEVIADGIIGPGMSFEDGAAIVERDGSLPPAHVHDVYNAYGCNMIVRTDAARSCAARFDEDLPFYCWLEDVDFSRVMAPHGRIVKSNQLRGVHLGDKAGRSPGRRLGYSQIANPVHLKRKGTMTPRRAIAQMGRNVAMNALRTLNPEPWVDRRGRLAGNAIALGDWVTGRLHPGRVLEME